MWLRVAEVIGMFFLQSPGSHLIGTSVCRVDVTDCPLPHVHTCSQTDRQTAMLTKRQGGRHTDGGREGGRDIAYLY